MQWAFPDNRHRLASLRLQHLECGSRGEGMIQLTRIDGTVFYLNPDLIEVVEASHDTHVTLTNGHHYVCAEPPEVLVERIAGFRRLSFAAVRRAS